MTVLSLEPDPILELALGFVESVIYGGGCRLERAVVRRRMAHDNLVFREAQVNGDLVAISAPVMMSREIEHNVAGNDAVEEVLELLRARRYVRGERVGVGHISERELESVLHITTVSTRSRVRDN